jgi:choline dehydrogenase-like flavoprotein
LQALEPRWKDLRSWNRQSGPMVDGDRRRVHGYHHVRGVGGTTLHFTGEAHRLHPRAMKMGSAFGVAADWPLDYGELEPYYSLAEKVVGVAGPADDKHRHAASLTLARASPELRQSATGRGVSEAGAQLGCQPHRRLVGALRWPTGLQLLRQLQSGLSAHGQGQRRRNVPAAGRCDRALQHQGALSGDADRSRH